MGLLETIQDAIKVVQKSDNIELVKEMMSIQSAAWELAEENKDLKEEIKDLKSKLKIKGNISFKNNAYWIEMEGNTPEGPFCSGCWDKEKNTIRLHLNKPQSHGTCPVCKTGVTIDHNYKSPTPSIPKLERF